MKKNFEWDMITKIKQTENHMTKNYTIIRQNIYKTLQGTNLVFVTDAVFCPQTLPAQAAMILKHLLQNASSTTMEYVLTPDRAKLKESIDDQINQIDRYTVCFVLCIKS